MSQQTLLEEIEDAPVEALLDPDGAIRRSVVALHVRAAMAPSHNERMLYAAQAAAAEGRLARMFAEACLKNLVSIRRALYAYVDERIAGEEARLPALSNEAARHYEALITAAEQLLHAGGAMSRDELNLLSFAALVDTTRLAEIRENLRPGFEPLEAGQKAYLSGLLGAVLAFVHRAG